MSSNRQLFDGLGNEYIQSSSGAEKVTANTNIYATTISGTTLQGTYISGTDVRFTASTVAGKLVSSAGTGSASLTWGRFIEAGSSSLSAGSSVWLVFPTAFTVAPFIQLQSLTTAGNNDLWVSGTRVAGSVFVMGKTASEAFNWLAIG